MGQKRRINIIGAARVMRARAAIGRAINKIYPIRLWVKVEFMSAILRVKN